MILVFALQLLRVFQSFETEYLLGVPFGFYVYSTKIFALIRDPIPNYGEATVLASITLLMIALIIPLQRWILERRRYTTITGSFRPGLIDLGRWNTVAFGLITSLLVLLTVGPLIVLVLGSFMTRIGYFVLGFTFDHWKFVLSDPVFVKALRTTLLLGITAAIVSPLLFSVIAYILVRTRLPGRGIAGPDGLVFRGDPGYPRGPRSFVVVSRHARAQLSLRNDLGSDHRGHPPGQNHGCERYERGVRAGRLGYGGSRARVRSGLDQNLLPDLATAADAQFDAAGSHELRQCSRRHRQHYPACFPRYHDAFAHGPGIVVDCHQQSGGCEYHQHLHHRLSP